LEIVGAGSLYTTIERLNEQVRQLEAAQLDHGRVQKTHLDRIAELGVELATRDQNIVKLEHSLSAHRDHVALLESQVAEISKVNSGLLNQITSFENQLEAAQLEHGRIQKAHLDRIAELGVELATCDQNIVKLGHSLSAHQDHAALLESQVAEISRVNSGLLNQIASLENAASLSKSDLAELEYSRGLRSADRLIELDFPVRPRVRYGWEKKVHPDLLHRIAAGDERYDKLLQAFVPYLNDISRIAKQPQTPEEPHWINDWFPAFDAISLYGLLALKNPKRFVEIGSGTSTKFARRAIHDQQLSTKIVSIDPFPRSEIDAICDEVVRLPLEDVPAAFFEALTPDDFLFFDGSHRSFQNSDATVFFTEILPRLPVGMVVGVHDIFLPHDYPDDWLKRFYSEQYLLACWLLAGRRLEIELPLFHCTKTPALHAVLNDFWMHPALAGANHAGGAFWFSCRDK
jgi:hypothetical protein